MWWLLWPRRRCAALHPPIPSAPCLSSGCHSSPLQAPVTSSHHCLKDQRNVCANSTYIRNDLTIKTSLYSSITVTLLALGWYSIHKVSLADGIFSSSCREGLGAAVLKFYSQLAHTSPVLLLSSNPARKSIFTYCTGLAFCYPVVLL